jgi:zinc protease
MDERSVTMKSGHIAILVIVALCISVGTSTASEIESFTVNGLKVIFKQNTAADIVSANMYFRGGASILSNDQAGIERLALTVAVKASERYPKEMLNAALERMSSQLTSASGIDFSSINLQCVKQYFGESWDIFADVIRSPLLTDADVALERERLITGIKQMKDNPDAYLGDLLRKAFYVDHPYSVDVDGTVETVTSFSAATLKQFYKARATTSNMLLVVVGNTTRAELEGMVRKSFESLPAGSYSTPMPPPVSHQEPSLKIVEREIPTNYISGWFPCPGYGQQESYPMMVGTAILRARVWEEVRTKRSLSYAPSAGMSADFSNHGSVYVSSTQPDSAIRVIRREVEKMRTEPVGMKELRDHLNQYVTRYYLQNETSRNQAGILARYELSGAGYQESTKFLDHLKAVTPESIQSLSEKYMKNLQSVLLGNPESLDVQSYMF